MLKSVQGKRRCTPTPWQTNAASRITEFLDRENLDEQDAIALAKFAKRLTIDPYDTLAQQSHDGEWVHHIGPSVTRPDRALAIAYRINDPYRYVEVISAFYTQLP